MEQKLFTGDFFPYGTHYFRYPTPQESEWETDFAELARQKYTHVQFRPQWRQHERIRGKYEWDQLDRLFELAQKYGMKVVLQVMHETAPDWVYTELHGHRIGFSGIPLEPNSTSAFYVGGWLPCFDNPEVAKAAYEFSYQLANRYKDHPALWFFSAWNEPRSRPAGECRCQHSIQSYRDYLKERYGTIEALNEAFGKAWTSFDTILPAATYSDFTELYLWRQWAEHSVAHRVRVSYEGLKAGAPEKAAMTHVGVSSVIQDPVSDTSNDVLNAKQVDFYGCSYIVYLNPKDLTEHSFPLYQCAWMRCVDKNYWVWEFYANHGRWCKNAAPAWLEQMLLMAFSSGCKGLTFWQYRSERYGEESNGWGMRNIDGSSTPRSDVCDKISHFAATLGREFSDMETGKSKVALLYHRNNYLLSRIQTICLAKMEDLWMEYDFDARKGLLNAFTMYLCLGNAPDFVTETDDFSGYDILHVSAVEMMDDALADRMRDYCRNGGTLIISHPFASRDYRTWVTPDRPSCGLQDLTGCREGLRQVIEEEDDPTANYSGLTIRSGSFMTELIPDGGTVLANWNSFPGAAIVEHSYGKGNVITCGASPELGWNKDINDDNLKLLGTFLKQKGIPVSENPMIWQLNRGDYQFIFNPGTGPQPFNAENGTIVHSCNYQKGMLGDHGSIVLKLK